MNDTLLQGLLYWLGHGLTDWSWWQVLLATLVLTHITIAAVTIYLHRHQAHRAMDLHPAVAHFFRFWLWLTTGMQTNEWVAIHRKHHAKCETPEDPHSPQTRGIQTVFWQGSELYRAEAKNLETLARFSHGVPRDWLERHIYNRYQWQGVALMMIVDLALFGALGLTVWAVQMAWIPVTAAGVINGIGHYWGYRNFEAPDASRNITPWGILIGGEELHNNHHTYPTSAKFKVKPYEFDLGWIYISGLQKLGLAKVKKTPPSLSLGAVKPVADAETLEALITHRYELMAHYGKVVKRMVRKELVMLKAAKRQHTPEWKMWRNAKRWLHRDSEHIPQAISLDLEKVQSTNQSLATMLRMRKELQQLWQNTHLNREQLLEKLKDWCQHAEASGVQALRDFALRLKAARV